MYCSKCGIELKENSYFCSSCGFSLQKKDLKDENKSIIEQFIGVLKLSLKWSGRFSRRQYVTFWVGFAIFNFFIALLIILTGLDVWLDSTEWAGIVALTWMAIMAIFSYSAAIRRFHDLDLSGWYVLFMFIPIVYLIVFVKLMVEKGKEAGETRWG